MGKLPRDVVSRTSGLKAPMLDCELEGACCDLEFYADTADVP